MKQIKIFGAGSIGNHLAHASRRLGWNVTVCDVDDAALKRMKEEIYPARYKSWDESIQLFNNKSASKGGFDLIIIGTPPEHHVPLALEALKENPKAILVEKPLCPPSMKQAQQLFEETQRTNTHVFVGYTHAVGKAMKKTEEIIRSGAVGDPRTLDVEFREHWEGIFKAHPWLKGPADTYLGYWEKGGGASGEHSHAIHLWQHLAHVCGWGRVTSVTASLRYVKEGRAWYDDLCLLNLQTERGALGRVVQDVVTKPSKKLARIQGAEGAIEWIANYSPEGDAVVVERPGKEKEITTIPKTRPDDFIEELKQIESDMVQTKEMSALSLTRGLDTMLVIAAAHESQKESKTIKIDYKKGYAAEKEPVIR